MAKYTRNSYKRKIIMFGMMIFISIALISTGFAAWVLSTQTKVDNEGNVTVGVVENKSFEITFTEIKDQNGNDLTKTEGGKIIADSTKMKFSFEPVKDDEQGRVRWNGTASENLSITFKGTIKNATYLGSFNVKMTMTEEVKSLVGSETSRKYIIAPDCAKDSGVELKDSESGAYLSSDNYKLTMNGDGSATFEVTVKFGWGDLFGNENPSTYYDTNLTGQAVSDEKVKSILEDFHNVVNGKNTKFTITFTATAN